MNWKCHLKIAKNGLQFMSLIAPTILELEKSLYNNKFFCSNIKHRFTNFSLAFNLFDFTMWRRLETTCWLPKYPLHPYALYLRKLAVRYFFLRKKYPST